MAAIAQDEVQDERVLRRFSVRDAAALCTLALLLVSALLISSYALWTEVVASRAEALASDAIAPGSSASSDLAPLAQVEALCAFTCQPRVLDAAATVRLAAAAELPADQRGPLLARAVKDLDKARVTEPLNGPVAIREAYAASLTPGIGPATVLELLEHSYAIQPYSKSGGFWRVGGVVRNWDIASPNLKSDALREALWLPITSAYDQKAITDLFETAGLGLQLHLAQSLPPV